MNIKLKNYTPLSICVEAIRTCWDSHSKGGCYPVPTDSLHDSDKELTKRIILKHKHGSTAEHLSYNFQIEGISRACLQELARHRMSSFSVKSSRYTLKELKDELPFFEGSCITDKIEDQEWFSDDAYDRACKYLVMTGNDMVDIASIQALDNLRDILQTRTGNDVAKYCLPESYKTSLAWTVNARSLQNFLALRTSSAALWEIRQLAQAIYDALPPEHQYLFTDYLSE